jgi:hypothetical protein
MTSLMEWHDSELVAVSVDSALGGVISLDAYVYRKGVQVLEAVEGGTQRVRISMPSTHCEDASPAMPAYIYGGKLVLEGVEHNDLVPLPMSFNGEVKLRLTMRDGQELLFTGNGMNILADGKFRFVEMVPFNPFVGEE